GSFELENDLFSFTVECSKGTYVRSLCRDIGERLGCLASMESLERTKACGITLKDTLTLSQIEELAKAGGVQQALRSIDEMFAGYEKLRVSGEDEKRVRNGNVFGSAYPDGKYRVYLEDGTFAAIYQVRNKRAQLCGYFLT
ncbi:MAG: hypothetical protein IK139_05600, partial [Lachnospiraceae bacterium]|nr:hypothetical protein [Lachnospiraceae bacterium]